jgi:putative sterol carrier protein
MEKHSAMSARRAYVPALEGVHGKIHVLDGEASYLLELDDGDVVFAPGSGSADCVLTCLQEGDMMRIARGELNFITAALQGRIHAEGDLSLLLTTTGALVAFMKDRGSTEGGP